MEDQTAANYDRLVQESESMSADLLMDKYILLDGIRQIQALLQSRGTISKKSINVIIFATLTQLIENGSKKETFPG